MTATAGITNVDPDVYANIMRSRTGGCDQASGKAEWRVRLGVGCVVANYQNVTVTSHTYEYCAAGAFVRSAFLAAKHSGCTKVGQLHFIFKRVRRRSVPQLWPTFDA
jgi:hypothetical protein